MGQERQRIALAQSSVFRACPQRIHRTVPTASYSLITRGTLSAAHYIKVLDCPEGRRLDLYNLFVSHGWDREEDVECRQYLHKILGPDSDKSKVKGTTFISWATDFKDGLVGAAILLMQLYRDRRRCGKLMYIVSASKGAGKLLIHAAHLFLRSHDVPRFFSAA